MMFYDLTVFPGVFWDWLSLPHLSWMPCVNVPGDCGRCASPSVTRSYDWLPSPWSSVLSLLYLFCFILFVCVGICVLGANALKLACLTFIKSVTIKGVRKLAGQVWFLSVAPGLVNRAHNVLLRPQTLTPDSNLNPIITITLNHILTLKRNLEN